MILTYHSVSAGRSPLRIAPAVFSEQMEWLRRNARVASLAELAETLRQGKPVPARTVALTFDDGFGDFYSDAAPQLRRFGFPATIFLPTSFCGQSNCWPGQPAWVERQPLLDWSQIAELAGEAFSFGSHSATHRDLTLVPEGEAEQEIVASKREIERRLGKPAPFFSYPYGRWNGAIRKLVCRHYSGACSTLAAIAGPGADLYALPRVDAHYVRDPHLFRALFTEGFCVYLAARRLIRRARGEPEGLRSRR